MVTYWKTDPVMEPPSHRQRRGPQIYVHVEFGVSWSSQHVPKNHEVTYKSRAIRERQPASFPRQIPAPNTNYLAAIHDFQQRKETRRQIPNRTGNVTTIMATITAIIPTTTTGSSSNSSSSSSSNTTSTTSTINSNTTHTTFNPKDRVAPAWRMAERGSGI